ncbi:MAG TPA: (Fe-S)-binding protein [Desulfotomaculum sp.]|nr:(Fe-S)-binding protein [Desulfotomaculum sp.]
MKVLRVRDTNRCIGCYSCMLACARLVFKCHSIIKSAILVRTRGGLQSKWGVDICRGCLDAPCAEACPTGALTQRPGGGVIFKKGKCSLCGECIEACIVRVIHPDDEGFPVICTQCGHCTRICPQEVLAMEEQKGV